MSTYADSQVYVCIYMFVYTGLLMVIQLWNFHNQSCMRSKMYAYLYVRSMCAYLRITCFLFLVTQYAYDNKSTYVYIHV